MIPELFKADPDNDRLPALDDRHWRRMPPVGPNAAKLDREIDDVLARTHNEKLKAEAYFARAQVGLYKSQQTGNLDLAGVEEFLKKEPKDERGPLLLYMATFVTRDEKAKESLEDRILKEYPDSQVRRRRSCGTRRSARPSASRSSWNSPMPSRARPSR